MTQTVTRLFDNFDDAKAAVVELERLGVPHSDISIIASNADDRHAGAIEVGDKAHDVGAEAGKGAAAGVGVGGVLGLIAGLGIVAIPGLGPVVAAGWLVSTAVGAVAGGAVGGATGGLVGAMTRHGVSEEHAHVYAEGVRRGGSLVSVRVDDDHRAAVEEALDGLNTVDPVERRQAYSAEGWTAFDDDAPALTSAEVDKERARIPARV